MKHETSIIATQEEWAGGWDGPCTPPHYQEPGGIECVDAMRSISSKAEFVAFCRLTALKYLWRMGKKGPAIYDLEKCRDYINWAIKRLEDE